MSARLHPSIAYKICAAAEWAAAVEAGRYSGSAVDLADGFIHLSAPDQTRETARKWFAGRPLGALARRRAVPACLWRHSGRGGPRRASAGIVRGGRGPAA
jgi:hypothetical protein